MTEFDGVSWLSESDSRLFGHWRRRAREIGEEEGENNDDLDSAKSVAVARLRGECGSIIGMIVLGLLVKVAVEAIWAILKKRFPAKYVGDPPRIESEE